LTLADELSVTYKIKGEVMKLFLSSVLLAFLLSCTGCSEDKIFQKPHESQGDEIVEISPKISSVNTEVTHDKVCKDVEFYRQIHYYELRIDTKLVYRNRLRTVNEEDAPTKWQMSLGKHKIRIVADGFIPLDIQVEIVQINKSATTQYFGVILTPKKQAEVEKKPH
jgi:hypothetical protein